MNKFVDIFVVAFLFCIVVEGAMMWSVISSGLLWVGFIGFAIALLSSEGPDKGSRYWKAGLMGMGFMILGNWIGGDDNMYDRFDEEVVTPVLWVVSSAFVMGLIICLITGSAF